MAPTRAVLRLGLGVAAGAVLLGACGIPAAAQGEAAAAAVEFVHALGRGDAATMCALMSRDYQEQGFRDDGLGTGAPCLAKATSISAQFTDAERADLVAAAVDGIEPGRGARLLVRTTGSVYPMTVEVISEGFGAKVDDSYGT